MKNTKIAIALVILFVLILLAVKNSSKTEQTEIVSEEIPAMIETDGVSEETTDGTTTTTTTTESVSVENTSGTYEAYSPDKLAFAETGDVVLFFRASWCPSCRALDKDIKKNLSSIPVDVKILDVDFDNSKELRQRYGVTTQHTLVQVDKEGVMLAKWSGSPTLSSVVSQLK